jgi:hypothetical protein
MLILELDQLCLIAMKVKYRRGSFHFRLTCYKSFIPLEVKDSSLRLYMCHHLRSGKKMIM